MLQATEWKKAADAGRHPDWKKNRLCPSEKSRHISQSARLSRSFHFHRRVPVWTRWARRRINYTPTGYRGCQRTQRGPNLISRALLGAPTVSRAESKKKGETYKYIEAHCTQLRRPQSAQLSRVRNAFLDGRGPVTHTHQSVIAYAQRGSFK